jgi:branched-chain amino acid aminotransferase
MSRSVTWSKTLTFFEDDWHEGNLPIMGVRTHAAWLCTSVFDGARAFEGVTPDLDLHCARVNESAKVMSLKPLVSTETWMALAREGLKRFDRDAELYIRPMYWPEDAASGAVRPDPETTRWCLTLYVAPLPKPAGTAITLSPFRRPTRETAPVDAKAGCLYPNIFSTGNYTKVSPVTRLDDRNLHPGPVYRQARELYWEFAHDAERWHPPI